MIALIKKIFTSEFLPVTEVRKLKVHIVMGFLFVITLITIPFSIFFEYSLLVKILSLLAFVLTYALCILLVKFNKIFTAIHINDDYNILPGDLFVFHLWHAHFGFRDTLYIIL
jgi:hypothetical protein